MGDREGQTKELRPDVEAAWGRFVEHVRAVRRRRAKRDVLAFLVIVVYGGIVANFAQAHDVLYARHKTLATWFWPVLLGFVAFALVSVLLRDQDDE